MAITPMMQQYLEIKEQYKDCILFFRLGDFYEMFFEDAKLVSRELELTLTGKDCGLEQRAPMCGIPYHSVNIYIPKLIERGYKIAIGEQVEDPKEAKGIVKREVVKIITPGTITETSMLDETKNNYISSLLINKDSYILAYSDISTGDFYVTCAKGFDADKTIFDEISKISPSEIVLPSNIYSNKGFINKLNKRIDIYISAYDNYEQEEGFKNLISDNLESLEIKACLLLYNYIFQVQKQGIDSIKPISKYEIEKFMQLDAATRKNLEVIESNREKSKKGSLLWVLDKTVTAMGGRLMRRWVEAPLLDKSEIIKRQNAIALLKEQIVIRDDLIDTLKVIYDIERIIAKIVSENCNARDLIALKNSIEKLPALKAVLKQILNEYNDEYILELYTNLDLMQDVYELISKSIEAEPPITIKEGGIIKTGYDANIDELKSAKFEGKNWILELETREKELTSIKNLKVGFNKIFGYFIEVTNSYKNLVPIERYTRKQTLANCERYITQELKEIEEKVLGAEEKLMVLEYKKFCIIREEVAKQVLRVQEAAQIVATLDVLCSLAKVADDYNYIKPDITDNGEIKIIEGRHAVVEKALKDETFIPNDVYLNNEQDRFLIITGPNMAGKSTYMRQVAISVYMAQIGSFIPAKSASISLTDRIFTRVGASDDLSMGQSTFMVEMSELANILDNATSSSLIILDEIGRGTSTYDGLAIAWSTVEYINDKSHIGAKTLFATHYHELTELEEKLEGVKNYSVEVKEKGEDVIFLRKIIKGGADESYGIYVAKIAGVPKKVLKRAKEILKYLESMDVAKKKIGQNNKASTEEIQVDMYNYKLAEIERILKKTNLDELTAKEALDVLYRLKEKI